MSRSESKLISLSSDAAYSLRLLVIFVVYGVGVVVAAAVLAPLAYGLLSHILEPGLSFAAFSIEFLKLCALAGAWPLMKLANFNRAQDWGYGPGPEGLKDAPTHPRRRAADAAIEVAEGFVAGILSLGVVALLLLALEVRVSREDFQLTMGGLIRFSIIALLSALVIASIEETWYRGALHTLATRAIGTGAGIVLVSVFFAGGHFLHSSEPAYVHWASGFEAYGEALWRLGRSGFWANAWDSFAALLIGGVLLSVLRERRGRIAYGIGLHAGWVLVIKLLRKSTAASHHTEWDWLVGSYDQVIGLLAAFMFTLHLWYLRRTARGAFAS